jgi:hypothetical protein
MVVMYNNYMETTTMTQQQKAFIAKENSPESSWIQAVYVLPFNGDGTGAFPVGTKGDKVAVVLRKSHLTPNRKVQGKPVCDVLPENGCIAEVFRSNVEA